VIATAVIAQTYKSKDYHCPENWKEFVGEIRNGQELVWKLSCCTPFGIGSSAFRRFARPAA
jgi:hypothetical protein